MSESSSNIPVVQGSSAPATERPRPIVRIIEPVREQIEQDLSITPGKLRVAAYARVSTEQDEQESSYEAQVDYYTNYIASQENWNKSKSPRSWGFWIAALFVADLGRCTNFMIIRIKVGADVAYGNYPFQNWCIESL